MWNDLTGEQKIELMSIFRNNGIYDIDQMKSYYDGSNNFYLGGSKGKSKDKSNKSSGLTFEQKLDPQAKAFWKVAKKMYIEMIENGIDPLSAAGILGNIAQESGFDPKASNNVSGGHYGLVQNDKNIMGWIYKQPKYKKYDYNSQMQYIYDGYHGRLAKPNMGLQNRFNDYRTMMKGVTTPEDAAYAWERAYEKSSNENIPERRYFARWFYDNLMKEEPQYFKKGYKSYKSDHTLNDYTPVTPTFTQPVISTDFTPNLDNLDLSYTTVDNPQYQQGIANPGYVDINKEQQRAYNALTGGESFEKRQSYANNLLGMITAGLSPRMSFTPEKPVTYSLYSDPFKIKSPFAYGGNLFAFGDELPVGETPFFPQRGQSITVYSPMFENNASRGTMTGWYDENGYSQPLVRMRDNTYVTVVPSYDLPEVEVLGKRRPPSTRNLISAESLLEFMNALNKTVDRNEQRYNDYTIQNNDATVNADGRLQNYSLLRQPAFNMEDTYGSTAAMSLSALPFVLASTPALSTMGSGMSALWRPVAQSMADNPYLWADAMSRTAGSMLLGETTNAALEQLTGKTWGENLNELTGGVVPTFLGEFTNPGYYFGDRWFGPVINTAYNTAGRGLSNALDYLSGQLNSIEKNINRTVRPVQKFFNANKRYNRIREQRAKLQEEKDNIRPQAEIFNEEYSDKVNALYKRGAEELDVSGNLLAVKPGSYSYEPFGEFDFKNNSFTIPSVFKIGDSGYYVWPNYATGVMESGELVSPQIIYNNTVTGTISTSDIVNRLLQYKTPGLNIDGSVLRNKVFIHPSIESNLNYKRSEQAVTQISNPIKDLMNSNIKWLQEFMPGFKPMGSSVGSASGAIEIRPHDIDGYMLKRDFDAFREAHPELDIYRKHANSDDTWEVVLNKDWGEAGVVDVNIVSVDEMGIGNKRAMQLYQQFFPDEYSNTTLRLSTEPELTRNKNFKDYFPIWDKSGKPMTAEQLLDRYDPEVGTVLDSFMVDFSRPNKAKHATRILSYFAGDRPDIVHKALQKYADMAVGGKGKGRLFPKLIYGNKEQNIKLLESIGFVGDLERIAVNEAKMQNVLDAWYLTEGGTFGRAAQPGDRGEGHYGTVEKLIRNFSKWLFTGEGGTAQGYGQNWVAGADSGAMRDLVALLQPEIKGLKEGMSAEQAVFVVKRAMLHPDYHITADEASLINSIYAKYDIRSKSGESMFVQEGMTGADLLYKAPDKGKAIYEANKEIADALGINFSTGDLYVFHNESPYYTGAMRDFEYDASNLSSGRDAIGLRRFDGAGESKMARAWRDRNQFITQDARIPEMYYDLNKLSADTEERLSELANEKKELRRNLEDAIDKLTDRHRALTSAIQHGYKVESLVKKLEKRMDLAKNIGRFMTAASIPAALIGATVHDISKREKQANDYVFKNIDTLEPNYQFRKLNPTELEALSYWLSQSNHLKRFKRYHGESLDKLLQDPYFVQFKEEWEELFEQPLFQNINNYAYGGPIFQRANVYGLGDWLKRAWKKVNNAAQVAAIAENPAVMTAAGHRINRQGKVEYNHANDPWVKRLRNNLAVLGENAALAPTAVKDISAAATVVRHPIRTAKNIQKIAKGTVNKVKNLIKNNADTYDLYDFPNMTDYVRKELYTTPQQAIMEGQQKALDYLGSERHIQQIMKSGKTRQEATEIANQMNTNALRALGSARLEELGEKTGGFYNIVGIRNDDSAVKKALKVTQALLGRFKPTFSINKNRSIHDIIEATMHEFGGHGATLGYIDTSDNALASGLFRQYNKKMREWFPKAQEVYKHNASLKPIRKPEYKNSGKRYLKYLEDVDEYSARARVENMQPGSEGFDAMYEYFTKESVDRLRDNVWGIAPWLIGAGTAGALYGTQQQGDSNVQAYGGYLNSSNIKNS